jgi:heat shock protein HtpX
MQFIKGVSLFMMVNVAIMVTIGFIIKALNLEPMLEGKGINYTFLLGFCLLWGMGGAFISLMLSKIMAKWMMGLQVIDPNNAGQPEKQLLNTVYALSHKAGLTVMPEVAFYESNEINAFATGPSKNNSLVAVSSGLLNKMNQKELEGVLGHEIAHIANGDMVTMTLLQGVVNAFAMFLARIIAQLVTRSGKEDNRNNSFMMEFMVRMVLEIVFTIIGSLVVRWFSRYREYRADAGGARYAGKQNMINALQALKNQHSFAADENSHQSDGVQTLMISNRKSSLMALFSTHPPLEDRIERLKSNRDLM